MRKKMLGFFVVLLAVVGFASFNVHAQVFQDERSRAQAEDEARKFFENFRQGAHKTSSLQTPGRRPIGILHSNVGEFANPDSLVVIELYTFEDYERPVQVFVEHTRLLWSGEQVFVNYLFAEGSNSGRLKSLTGPASIPLYRGYAHRWPETRDEFLVVVYDRESRETLLLEATTVTTGSHDGSKDRLGIDLAYGEVPPPGQARHPIVNIQGDFTPGQIDVVLGKPGMTFGRWMESTDGKKITLRLDYYHCGVNSLDVTVRAGHRSVTYPGAKIIGPPCSWPTR